ncbi:MAG: hypothetical protein KDD02_24215 [Phaeodactylibacter sp.]|nr:hypothetical protein [Phaeodactylibacter sp.]
MKNYNILFLMALGLLGLFSSCQQAPDKESEKILAAYQDFPKLLDRHESIQQGKEWEHVQNLFGEYRQKLIKDPQDNATRLSLAELFINEARVTGEHGYYYPAALEALNGIRAKPEEKDLHFRALSAKAGVQLSLHDFSSALETATEAVSINPYNAQIYGALVDANVELGHYDEAVAMADKMVAIRPDLRSYARVSYLREIYGDVEGSIEAMKLAVSAGYPGYEQTAWARLTLGRLYEHYRSLEEAEQQFQMVLAERPDYPFAIAALGDIALQRKDYAKAERLLKKAATIIPEFSFYESLARLYKTQGRNQEFQATMDELLQMFREDTESGHDMNLEYAKLYSNLLDDPEKALEYAQKEYNRRPDNIDVNRVMASIYFKRGETELATRRLEVATRTHARYPELADLQMQLAVNR